MQFVSNVTNNCYMLNTNILIKKFLEYKLNNGVSWTSYYTKILCGLLNKELKYLI